MAKKGKGSSAAVRNSISEPSITPRNNNPVPVGGTEFRGHTMKVKFSTKKM